VDADEEELAEAAVEEPEVPRLEDAPENVPPPDEPVDPVPEVDDDDEELVPDPEEEDEPVTCCPTVKLIDATVPAMVDVNVAWFRAVCALATWFWATRMPAWSDAIWAAEAPSSWSVVSWAWSLARLAWAWASEAANDVSSMVARAWPAVTVCPALTSTAVTRPDWPKLRLACSAGSMVPDEDTVWVIVPVETVWTEVVVVISGEALELVVASQMPNPAATATITAAVTIAGLRVNHFLLLVPTYASLAELLSVFGPEPSGKH
jgi:hypothetical protein